MKKNINRIFITLVVIMMSFFVGVNSAKALDQCDFENNYGSLETRTQKIVAADFGSTINGTQAYNMDNMKITTDGDWDNESTGAGYKDFYWVYAANHGYIKDAKFTVYSDDGSSTKIGKKNIMEKLSASIRLMLLNYVKKLKDKKNVKHLNMYLNLIKNIFI